MQVQQGRLIALVRAQTFQPRAGLDILFVAVDVQLGAVMMAWLVRSGSRPLNFPNVSLPDSPNRGA
jgi:hypothetical protein